jgi:hypothetical protein
MGWLTVPPNGASCLSTSAPSAWAKKPAPSFCMYGYHSKTKSHGGRRIQPAPSTSSTTQEGKEKKKSYFDRGRCEAAFTDAVMFRWDWDAPSRTKSGVRIAWRLLCLNQSSRLLRTWTPRDVSVQGFGSPGGLLFRGRMPDIWCCLMTVFLAAC